MAIKAKTRSGPTQVKGEDVCYCRLPRAHRLHLDRIAEREDRPRASLIRIAVLEFLDRDVLATAAKKAAAKKK